MTQFVSETSIFYQSTGEHTHLSLTNKLKQDILLQGSWAQPSNTQMSYLNRIIYTRRRVLPGFLI